MNQIKVCVLRRHCIPDDSSLRRAELHIIRRFCDGGSKNRSARAQRIPLGGWKFFADQFADSRSVRICLGNGQFAFDEFRQRLNLLIFGSGKDRGHFGKGQHLSHEILLPRERDITIVGRDVKVTQAADRHVRQQRL